jgi:hypothetical protein
MEWTPLLKWCLVFAQIFSLALLIIYLKLKKKIEDLSYELKEKTREIELKFEEKIRNLDFEIIRLKKKE